MHKKASLEISIQAIIIIVLAMVLLSLGIVFIRGQFGKIIDIGGQVTDQIREQILDDLRRGDKKLSFPSNDIQIERNKAVTIAIGVKNIEPSDLKFGILVYSIDKNDGEAGKPDDLIIEFDYNRKPQSQTLKPTEANVYPIRIKASQSQTGTQQYKLVIYEEGVAKPAIAQVSNLIKAGQYKEAQELADRVIRQDVKLVWTGSSASKQS